MADSRGVNRINHDRFFQELDEIVHPESERRGNDSVALTLIMQIHTDVKETDRKLTEHIAKEESEGVKRMADVVRKAMGEAFPDGDASGHRRHHEAVIAKAEADAAFWSKMRYELFQKGLFVFLGWALYTLAKSIITTGFPK